MNKIVYKKPVKVLNSKLAVINRHFDEVHDKKLVGMSLGKYVPSQHREDMGATGSESTPYCALRKMIGADTFDENDVFADIGCGKGRVLAYMAAEYGFKGKIRGVELNDEVAQLAAEWAKQF
ncbi:MAG: class I SAM-dependent methyltransferase, partial [Eubacterium sp.]|nr:class I SAM-dependent methyltransferase [Eubacterium sp.]